MLCRPLVCVRLGWRNVVADADAAGKTDGTARVVRDETTRVGRRRGGEGGEGGARARTQAGVKMGRHAGSSCWVKRESARGASGAGVTSAGFTSAQQARGPRTLSKNPRRVQGVSFRVQGVGVRARGSRVKVRASRKG